MTTYLLSLYLIIAFGHHQEERTLFKHEWVFIAAPQKNNFLVEAGTHQWNFELALPGDLPESVEGTELGEVSYNLKAVAERPGLMPNYTDKVHIQLTRYLLPSAMEYLQSLSISNSWVDKIMYDVDIPSKVYGEGDKIPVTFRFTPIAPDIRIRSVVCVLKEYTSYTIGSFTKNDGRILTYISNPHFPSEGAVWEHTEIIQVPCGCSKVHSDTENDMIRIRHKLKFIISIFNSDGHISELRAGIPIMISPINQNHEMNSLPAYEDIWRTSPCDPNFSQQALAEAAGRNDSSESLSSLIDETDRPNLMRAPSYNTAVTTRDYFPFSSSLPLYDYGTMEAAR